MLALKSHEALIIDFPSTFYHSNLALELFRILKKTVDLKTFSDNTIKHIQKLTDYKILHKLYQVFRQGNQVETYILSIQHGEVEN